MWKGHVFYVITVTKTPFVSAECLLKAAISFKEIETLLLRDSLQTSIVKWEARSLFFPTEEIPTLNFLHTRRLLGSWEPQIVCILFPSSAPKTLELHIACSGSKEYAVPLHTSKMNMKGTSQHLIKYITDFLTSHLSTLNLGIVVLKTEYYHVWKSYHNHKSQSDWN